MSIVDPSVISGSQFDRTNPPSQTVLDSCVHCGFCLSTCPSYRVLGTEMDSPRGRIYLMNAITQGEAELNVSSSEHFDSCLGCLACVSTCPSGVRYDQLIMATRPQVERNQPRTLVDRLIRALIFNLFPYPNRLRLLLPTFWLYQKSGLQKIFRNQAWFNQLFPRLSAMESILPTVNPETALTDNLPEIIPAQGEKRYRVGMVLGCVQRLFFNQVNLATINVLTANGCEIVIPRSQGCCAALPAHQGQEEQARSLARQMIDSFSDQNVDYVIINAAGCGHTLKEYDHLLENDAFYRDQAKEFKAKVRDVQEFLIEVGVTAKLHPLTSEILPIVYQDACHLLHGQKISLQPRQLLTQIPNIIIKEPLDSALCCGSAGVYNMLEPETAQELGQQKVTNLLNTGAKLISSSNPGCSLQILKHLQLQNQSIPLFHPLELLDYSIRNVKLKEVLNLKERKF